MEFDVVGRDAGGSKAFRDVGNAAERAADQIDDVGAASAKAGDQVERLSDKVRASGEQTEDTGSAYRGLAHEIAEVEGGVRRLAGEIDRTGNKDLFKDLRRQQVELRKLTRIRDLLPDNEVREEGVRYGARFAEGLSTGLARAGGPISAALSSVFGGLPPQAQAAIGAGVVAAAASVAPLVGGAIGGAVVGAVGVGGIVGGIAIAARHPQVQDSAKQTGDLFAETMQRAGVSFVPATLAGLAQVRDGISDMESDLQRAFSASAKFVEPLTEDFLAGGARAVEGFANAVERAGPAVDVLGEIGRRVGDLLADTFEGLSEHSTEGAHALMMLWNVFEFGIRSIAGTIEMLTAAYGWVEKLGALLSGDAARLAQLVAEQEAAKTSSSGLSDSMKGLVDSFTGAGNKAADAKSEIRSLRQIMDDFASKTLDVRAANREFEAAIDDATASIRENGRTLNAGTNAGRRNQEALDRIVEATYRKRDATLAATNDQAKANAVTERGRAAFLRAADAAGMEAAAAKRLADRLFGIPNVDRKVTVRTSAAEAAIRRVQAGLGRVNSKDIRIGVYYTTRGDLKLPGGTQLKGLSSGGPVSGPGPKGVDSRPYLLAPGEHVWTAAEVDAVGGQRAMEQLRAAVRGDARAAAPVDALRGVSAPARSGGFDEARLASAIARALSGATLRLDDRTGNYATLLSRGDG
ncbi:hypothetical protein [Micromonospora marina]|uniref:hypothetical protein n=1 Tax=Micromonospora marina TaxID=307120 RepID=UPI0034538CDE